MSNSNASPVLTELRERIQRLEGGAARAKKSLPFGVTEIDKRLPGGGLALGALHEVAGGGNGAVDGAAAALFAAGIAARTKGKILWCVTRQDLFAPAFAQAGLAPGRVIYVEAGDEKTLLACFEDGLRHGGLGAVVAEVARLSMTASRRLQLAAEGSGALALAVRRWRRQTEAADFGQGRIQREGEIVHLIANRLTDLSVELASVAQRGRGSVRSSSSDPGLVTSEQDISNRKRFPSSKDMADPHGHIDEIRVRTRDFR